MHLRLIPEEDVGLVLVDGTSNTIIVGIETTIHKGVSLLLYCKSLRTFLDLETEVTIVVGDNEVATLIHHILSVNFERSTIHWHSGLFKIDITINVESIVTDKVFIVELRLLLVQINRILFGGEVWIDGGLGPYNVGAVAVFHLGEDISTRGRGRHRFHQHFFSVVVSQQLHLYIRQSRTILEGKEASNLTCGRTATSHIIGSKRVHTVSALIGNPKTVFHFHTRFYVIVIIVVQQWVNLHFFPPASYLLQHFQGVNTLHIEFPLHMNAVIKLIVRSLEVSYFGIIRHRFHFDYLVILFERFLLPLHHASRVVRIDHQRIGILGT